MAKKQEKPTDSRTEVGRMLQNGCQSYVLVVGQATAAGKDKEEKPTDSMREARRGGVILSHDRNAFLLGRLRQARTRGRS